MWQVEGADHVSNDAVRQQAHIGQAGPDVLGQNGCDWLALVEVRAQAVVAHTPNHDIHHCMGSRYLFV